MSFINQKPENFRIKSQFICFVDLWSLYGVALYTFVLYLLELTTLLFNEYIIIKNVRAKTLKLTLKEKQSRQEENPIEFVIALTFHLLFVNSA